MTKQNDTPENGDSDRQQVDRRATILQALRRCILRNGYAATSFNEVAQEAGMSPSHVFYYFRGKEEVLRELYRQVAERVMANVKALQDQPLESQIPTMADYAFSGETFTDDDRRVLAELIGQSMHNPKIKDIRDELASTIVEYLTNFFGSHSSSPEQDTRDAAMATAALGTGLLMYACTGFIKPSDAQRLLVLGLATIRGLD